MAIVTGTALESNKNFRVNLDGGNLSSDGGLLLLKEFYHKMGVKALLKKHFHTTDPASFRFPVAGDTLAFGYLLPAAGRIRNFHPLECALAGRTTKNGLLRAKRGSPFLHYVLCPAHSFGQIQHSEAEDLPVLQ